MEKLKMGKKGEEIALQTLLKKGFVLLHRNYRYGRCEVDLIMEKGDTLVFIEVKLRKNKAFGYPEESLSHAQKERIRSVASHYQTADPSYPKIRFDIVSILGNRYSWEVEHFEDAF